MPNTLTTQHPNEPPQTRPVPPLDDAPGQASWATVAPLLEPPAYAGAAAACPGASQGQIALVPHYDGSWMVLSGYPQRRGLPRLDVHDVPFAGLPQAIAAVAARCEACTGRDPVADEKGEHTV